MYHILEHVFPQEVLAKISTYMSHPTADIMRERLRLHEHDVERFMVRVKSKHGNVDEQGHG